MTSKREERTKTNAEGTMAASVVAGTVAFAVAMGIPMEQITKATGLSLTHLVDPDARLSNRCAPAIWRLLRAAFHGQAIPLRMADCIPPSFFGPMAYAGQHAATMRVALETLVRYRMILSPELEVALIETPEDARLEIFHPADLEDHGWGSESAIAIGTRFIREVMGVPGFLKGISFAHEPAGAAEEYEQFFGVPVLFNQPSNALILHPELLDVPIAGSDPRWFMLIQGHMDIVHEKMSASERVDGLERIRMAIARCCHRGVYSAGAVARESGMSLRSLQRFVLARKITVLALIDETRFANACQLLTDETLSVDEVAFVVGYSTEGAFRRAFTRWAGVTPSQWRKGKMRSVA